MTDLKPCPFCGNEAAIINTGDYFPKMVFYRVICKSSCTMQGRMYKTIEAAVKAWNTREGHEKDDTISRQAAIEALDKRFDSIPMEQTSEILMLRKDLRELPPAQPERKTEEIDKDINVPSTDCISRQEAIDALRKGLPGGCGRAEYLIEQLPTAQPHRMRGRWIYGSPVTMKCDRCGYYIADWRQKESNYCPNCGARMDGGEQ